MRTTREFRLSLGIIGATAVLLIALVFVIQARYRQSRLLDAGRLAGALTQYARDVRSRGEPLPASVTLDALVRSGHLRPEDAKPFEGVKVIFHADADESHPRSLLVEAHMRDGFVLAGMADGSVQGFSPHMFEEFRKTQQDDAANGSQPVRSETNATSAAAGSRR